jgi:hypothetical protein
MMRMGMTGVALAVCGLLLTGCDNAREENRKRMAQLKQVATQIEVSTADEAKLAFLNPIHEALPNIEEKIMGLNGESATKAKEKLEGFKKLLEEFKSTAPGKWEAQKDGLMKSFDELKKLVGIDK